LFIFPALKQKPETGGELYNLRLERMLREHYDLRCLTLDELGVQDWRGDSGFAEAALREARTELPGTPVLQDTYFYPVFRPVNLALRRAAIGPIIGFGQAIYPDRFGSLLSRMRHYYALTRYLQSCDAHIVVSEDMKLTYARLGIEERRIVVVHPGHDLSAMPAPVKRAPLAGRALRVIVAGSYQPSKGQDIVVRGVLELLRRRPELHGAVSVVMHGNTEFCPGFYDSLRAEVAAHALEGVIQVLGPVSQQALWRRFSESDLLVFPASGEGRPLVVTEAMLNGCIPAVPAGGNSAGMITDGETGYLIERSVRGVAGVLERALREPEKIPALSTAVVRQARALFPDWSEVMQRYARALRRWLPPADANAPRPGAVSTPM
jgi:glycosyltransferase involved in cell wall biosynthesis